MSDLSPLVGLGLGWLSSDFVSPSPERSRRPFKNWRFRLLRAECYSTRAYFLWLQQLQLLGQRLLGSLSRDHSRGIEPRVGVEWSATAMTHGDKTRLRCLSEACELS